MPDSTENYTLHNNLTHDLEMDNASYSWQNIQFDKSMLINNIAVSQNIPQNNDFKKIGLLL